MQTLLLARDEVHNSVWCFLDVPHLARLSRLSRGRPRPCSRIISVCVYKRHSRVAGRSLSLSPRCPWLESRMAGFFFFVCHFHFVFCSNVKKGTKMTEVSSELSRSQFYMHTECCYRRYRCCCCCCCCCSFSRYTAVVGVSSCCCSSSCAGWLNLWLVH